MREIKALTSIRGIAALWVFLMHLSWDIPRSIEWPRDPFLARGHLAVDLFFALSGFVMAMTYRSAFTENGLSAFPAFMMKRIARVVPLNAALVLLIASVAVVLGSTISTPVVMLARSPSVLLQNLALVQTWSASPSLIPTSWSVSVEMAAYMLFPLLIWIAWSRASIAGLTLAVVSIGLLCGQGHGNIERVEWYGPIIRGLAGFFFGLLAYRWRSWAAHLGRWDWIILVIFVAASGWAASDFWSIAISPFLVMALSAECGLFANVLRWKPLHWLGVVSYSIYLNHYLMIWGAQQLPIHSPAIRGAVAIGATLLASDLTYRLIEQPGRRFVSALGAKLKGALQGA